MGDHTDFYDRLQGQGVSPGVAGRLDKLVSDGVISQDELDDRALDALKEFTQEDATAVIDQFSNSDLSHVQNKSAFLCGVMKTYRAKMKMKMAKEPAPEPAPVQSETTDPDRKGAITGGGEVGPNEEGIRKLLERTGYSLDITTGQRKYGGPPPGWEGPPPGTAGDKRFCAQVFIGKIPRDMYEDELIPIFEEFGTIYDFRLMIEPMSGLNKGYAFCTFVTKESAKNSCSKLDKYEIRPGKKLGVCLSQPNNRLFVGSIPKTKTKEQILEEFKSCTEGLFDVIVYISSEDKNKNRGFAFLEYDSHKMASQARRRLLSGRVRVFGNITPVVDWADPQEEPDEEIMSKVKVVYVRNLSPEIDEDKLTELFKEYGDVEKVKKIKDYAFVHFEERENALRAIEELNGQNLDDLKITVALAKPQTEKKERRRGQSGFGALNDPNSSERPTRFERSDGRRGGYDSGRGGGGGYSARGGRDRDSYDRAPRQYAGRDSYDSGSYDRGYDRGYSSYDQDYSRRYDSGGYGGESASGYGGSSSGGYGGSSGGGYGGSSGGYGGSSGGYGGDYYDDYYDQDRQYDSYYGSSRGGRSSTGRGGSSSVSRTSAPPRGPPRSAPSPRGGGSSMGRGGMNSRGRGSSDRGASGPRRGGPSPRGGMGSRPSMQQSMPPKRKSMDSGGSGPQPPKRKYEGYDQGSSSWNPQPIAQQPLSDEGYYDYGNDSSSQWYQDSYGTQWK